jgi:hypothetical protein
METTDVYRKMIVDEINFVAKKMAKAQSASEKLFYFSAVFGILHRILNIEYDSDLVFSQFVIRATHDAFLYIHAISVFIIGLCLYVIPKFFIPHRVIRPEPLVFFD